MESPRIRIVLVAPSHPGNIGAAARAMKNMALEELVLVNPKQFPDAEATARASGADDVLAAARVVPSLAQALEGCGFVAATTSRDRDQYFRIMDVRAAAARVVSESRRSPAAVVFGAERTGLTNEELETAHALIRIPASAVYPSLNLGMAVQLVTYELYRARGEAPPVTPTAPPDAPLATPAEMQRLYAHLAQVLEEIDFRDRTQSGTHLMGRIRRFLQRAELDHNEVSILRGILTAVQSRRRPALKSPRPLYLDYAATTPVDPLVLAVMSDCMTDSGAFGNPSSAHAYGVEAGARVSAARAEVAALIGATAQEIVFTSGATEANNLAILGYARANADRGRHLVSARTEHKSVLDAFRQLTREGFTISWLTPGASGVLEPDALAAALRPDTVLASLMYANNETGVLQDIAALAAVCHRRGVAFHSDAAQAAGKVPLDVGALGLDLLSFTAHKLYGPKGVGALYVRADACALLQPLAFGGGQERGLRPGTLPTHQLAGFGAACEIARRELCTEAARLTLLGGRLWAGLAALGGTYLNGAAAARVPGILNVSFEGVQGESLVAALTGLALSTGAACDSDSPEPSYVLRALGRDRQLAESSLRFSLGRFTQERDVDCAIEAVGQALARLRALYPGGVTDAADEPPSASAAGLAGGTGRVVSGEGGGPGQDSWVRFELLVAGDIVKDARFKAFGCPHTMNTAAWVCAELRGRPRTALIPGTPNEWARAHSVPVEKLGRLFAIEDALRACLAQWT